jgi:hypothetical protein
VRGRYLPVNHPKREPVHATAFNYAPNPFNPSAVGRRNANRRSVPRSPKLQSDRLLGQHDTSDRLSIPEKLYRRAREIETLLTSFDRIVKSGAPEIVLVSGYSGIGKSSVVNELHKELLPPRGLFASGKFDQYKRDIPYSTLVQAFQSLARPLLGKSDSELARRASGGAGAECTVHHRPHPRTEADHRRPAAGPGT